MNPIIQKIRHNKKENKNGDCLRACVCSILEISDENVPNFVDDKNYPSILLKFLNEHGYSLRYLDDHPDTDQYYIVSGISPRGIMHATVYHNKQMVHDPHPDGGGVIFEYCLILEKK